MINSGPSSTHIHRPLVADNRWIAFQLPVSMRCMMKQPNDGPALLCT
jgi:hypothetical protein